MAKHQSQCFRYSEAFKIQVIKDLESGKLANNEQARRYYGIKGTSTIKYWLKKYGRNDLMPKVVRVEKPNEQDQIKKLNERIKTLEKALADTQVESLVNRAQFEVICEDFGVDPEEYKKKVATKQSTRRRRHPLKRKKKSQ